MVTRKDASGVLHNYKEMFMTSVLTNNDVTNSTLNGDCLKLLPMVPYNSADFILTDPPYITSYPSRDGRTVPNDNNDA